MLGHSTSLSTLVLLLTWLCLVIQSGSAVEDAKHGLGQKLYQLTNPDSSEHCVDIVAVHGLDGHWRRSWTASNKVFWLQDLLPVEIPCARIFSYSHDSRTRGSETPLNWDVSDHATALLTTLSTERRLTETERTPILFIGHSLGGIILKAALLKAELARVGHLEHFKAIKLSTYAVAFLGTPHQGGEGIALVEVLCRISSIVSHTNTKILSKMERNSEWLQELQSDYNAISQDIETIFFYETLKMDTGIKSLLIVPKHSAIVSGARNSEEIPLIADHSSMSKFTTNKDDGFQTLVKRLRIFVKVAKPKVDENWKDWEWRNGLRVIQAQRRRVGHDGKEFALGIVSSIARNPYFTGRKEILRSLRQKLSSPMNSQGLSLVVLYGAGGMGKTQIATEYVHIHHADYTSVFWIDGSRNYTAAADILSCVHALKRHYEIQGLRDRPWYGHIEETLAKRFEGVGRKTQQDYPTSLSAAGDETLRTMFLAWLSSEGNCRWLMVIDNVDDLESFDFRDWLPPTLCGSIIMTSRRRDLAIHWNSIEVDGMTIDESIKLLNQSSQVVPVSHAAQDWNSAFELVQELGYLPLAISQAGDHIAMIETDSPVSNYLSHYRKHPKLSFTSRGTHYPWETTKKTVWTTWEISYEAVREVNPLAAELLLLCGFLSPRFITASLFIGQRSTEFESYQAFRILSSYSFLKRSDGSQHHQRAYTIHPLIHFWIRHRLDNDSQKVIARQTARLLQTYNKDLNHSEESNTISSGLHVKHLLSIYEELYPCDRHPSDFINIPARPSWEVIVRGVPQDYSIASFVEGWILRLRGRMDEFYFSAKAVYQSHEDYGHADYKLLFSLHQDTRGLNADTMDWILCQALSFYPPKHPRILEMIGNYAFSMSKDSRNSDIAVPWYWWLLLARMQILGAGHPATAEAYLGIGLASTDCEEVLTVQSTACHTGRPALGYNDSLTHNAMRVFAPRFQDCRYSTVAARNMLWPIDGLMELQGPQITMITFCSRFYVLYHLVVRMKHKSTALRIMSSNWSTFLEMLEFLFNLLPFLDHDDAVLQSIDYLDISSGLEKPLSSSPTKYEAWISAQPYLAGLHAMHQTASEVENSIHYPSFELEMHMSSFRQTNYWSSDGWNWRLLLPLTRSAADHARLPFDESFLLRNNAKNDPLEQRSHFKWFDLLGPVLLEVKLTIVNGRMVLYHYLYMDDPYWLTPTNFRYRHFVGTRCSYICEETFCRDRVKVLLILMGKLNIEGKANLLDLRMGN